MATVFGNTSSINHAYGDEAKEAVSRAAIHIAQLVGALPREIIFTAFAQHYGDKTQTEIAQLWQGDISERTMSLLWHALAGLENKDLRRERERDEDNGLRS